MRIGDDGAVAARLIDFYARVVAEAEITALMSKWALAPAGHHAPKAFSARPHVALPSVGRLGVTTACPAAPRPIHRDVSRRHR